MLQIQWIHYWTNASHPIFPFESQHLAFALSKIFLEEWKKAGSEETKKVFLLQTRFPLHTFPKVISF